MDQVGVEAPSPTEEEDEDDSSENAEAGKKHFLLKSSVGFRRIFWQKWLIFIIMFSFD